MAGPSFSCVNFLVQSEAVALQDLLDADDTQ